MSMQPGGMLPGLEPQGPNTKRLLTTVLLVTVMWIGFTWLMPQKAPPPKPTPPTPTATTPAPDTGTPAAATPPAVGADGAPVVATEEALPEEKHVVEADVAKASKADTVSVKGGYRAEITNHGAQLSGFVLTGYDDADDRQKPIDLAGADFQGARMLALRSRGGDVQLAADASYKLVSSDDHQVVYERMTPSGVRVTRTYTFDPDKFAFTDEVVLKNESAAKKTALLDVVLTGRERDNERSQGGMLSAKTDLLAGACKVNDKRETFTSKKVEDEAKTYAGPVTYAAIDRHFFLAAHVLDGDTTERCLVQPWKVQATGEKAPSARGFQIVVEHAPIELQPGESKTLKHENYFGPKQVGLLSDFGHDLGENINFGIFGVISRPMLWVLVKLHSFTGNFGLAIIMLTLMMKALTFPLTQKSYVSMQQVRKLKPEIDALQKKFGHDRTVMGQKQMELYKEKGVNPLAGCFPVLIQMPIWFALYRTLSQAVELYQQPFALGILDLTAPDHLLPFGISLLPLIVGGLMFFQTWLQPPPADQPQMKYMMWFMPVIFTFMMLSLASGLSMYMITNSLLTMVQQLYIKRKYR